jgi:short-subunit dehydrogenase
MIISFHALRSEVFGHVAITGASSGIGAVLARSLARPGASLALFGRDEERLERVAIQCRASGAEVRTIPADVTDAERLSCALLEIDALHPVTLLIANAGVGGASALAGDAGELADAARQILAVNTIGVVNTLTPLLPRMAARRQGHLAIIGSLSGYVGLPHAPAYCASKAAVRVYGEALRRQLKPVGVRVTVVCPGFIATPMSASLAMPLPYVWPAERAVERILRAIAQNKAEVAFPWQLAIAMRLLMLLPRSLADFLIARLAQQELSA